MRCDKRCSGHCLNNSSCHHIDGRCIIGCQDGFTGNLCNDCKSVYCILFIAIIIHCLSNVYCKSCQIWLQPAERDIMVQTVLASAPQTAKLVKPPTAHVPVMLVRWGRTVALVFFITNDGISFNI